MDTELKSSRKYFAKRLQEIIAAYSGKLVPTTHNSIIDVLSIYFELLISGTLSTLAVEKKRMRLQLCHVPQSKMTTLANSGFRGEIRKLATEIRDQNTDDSELKFLAILLDFVVQFSGVPPARMTRFSAQNPVQVTYVELLTRMVTEAYTERLSGVHLKERVG